MKRLICLALLLCVAGVASGSRRAIVIGNSAYQDSPLRNPVNDANLMAQNLGKLGFEVTLIHDADQQVMDAGFDRFMASVAWQDEVVFYYSGHGASAGGENYLIPVGRVIKDESELKYYAFSCNLAMEKLQKSQLSVMILDACRDNPFRGVRSGNKGLALMSGKAGSQYIIYSTELGKTAADGTDTNSPFTTTLARHMFSGDKITDMMQKVTKDVKDITLGQQIPWTAGNLIEDFYFSRPESYTSIASSADGMSPHTLGSANGLNSRPIYIDQPPGRVPPSGEIQVKPKKMLPFRVQPLFSLAAVDYNDNAPGASLGLEILRRQNQLLFGLGFEYELDQQAQEEDWGFEYFYQHIPLYAGARFESLSYKALVIEAIAQVGLSFAAGEVINFADNYAVLEMCKPGFHYGIGLGFTLLGRIVLQAMYKSNSHHAILDEGDISIKVPQFSASAGYRF